MKIRKQMILYEQVKMEMSKNSNTMLNDECCYKNEKTDDRMEMSRTDDILEIRKHMLLWKQARYDGNE